MPGPAGPAAPQAPGIQQPFPRRQRRECIVVYRVAATSVVMSRGRPIPRGELHAYLDGRGATLCGRALGDDVIGFDSMRWSARPIGLVTCKMCFARAR